MFIYLFIYENLSFLVRRDREFPGFYGEVGCGQAVVAVFNGDRDGG